MSNYYCDDCRAADRHIDQLNGRIEGLEADLESAVEVAYHRGAQDWVRLNYPDLYRRFRVRVPA